MKFIEDSLWQATSYNAEFMILSKEIINDSQDLMIYGIPGMYYKRCNGSIILIQILDEHYYPLSKGSNEDIS